MKPRSRGAITLLVIVFGGIFFILLAALASYVIAENHTEDMTRIQTEAFSIAEAGLEYYRWHLAHFPSDLKNGTSGSGPYAVSIPDPEGGTAGTASLTINGNTSCGQTTSIDITSVGKAAESPTFPQTLAARYARPSVALYSYIVNDSVWAGADRVINGPYHSNGGVRMDGTPNAPVSSSLSTWDCTTSYGCSPAQHTAAGVVGSGTNQSLWQYPTPQIDFAAIAADFTSLKTYAQASGIYLPRYSSGNSGNASYHRGYHLIFNADGTVTVKRVSTATQLALQAPVNSADPATDNALIGTESAYAIYTIPAGCGLIFVEDNTWVEGTVPRKVTLVAANVSTPGVNPDVFLKNNITYGVTDGTDGLTVISEHDVLITPDSPTNMTLDGVFIAQGGAFGRNLYTCPGSYEPRGSLTILGSTVSNSRTGTRWVNGCGASDGGYQNRTDAFDRLLSEDPPPFTPTTSSEYRFVNWRQE